MKRLLWWALGVGGLVLLAGCDGQQTFNWNVPRTGQGDDTTGAIRARVNPDAQNEIDVVDEITFR